MDFIAESTSHPFVLAVTNLLKDKSSKIIFKLISTTQTKIPEKDSSPDDYIMSMKSKTPFSKTSLKTNKALLTTKIITPHFPHRSVSWTKY